MPGHGSYQTIVADPPWEQGSIAHGSPDGIGTRELPYPSMGIEEICALPIHTLAARDCRLFLWTTNRFLEDAFVVQRHWGFRYVQTLVWHKPNQNPNGGSLAPNLEFLLVCRRGAPRRKARLPHAMIQASRTEHSVKPELFLDLIEQCSPGPYLELFARRQRLGWDTWGNQSLTHVELPGQMALG